MMAPSQFASEESPDGAQSAEREILAPPRRSESGGVATASLYRKYRPSSFSADELVGQEHIVRTLRNAISLNRVAHAYLFSGPRGTGKTTTARLLAKAVNCLDPDPSNRPCNVCANCQAINAGATPDIIEIDAASNRGIDDIRDLRERIRYAPAQLPSKVYIIDEAHQITGAAANAFLKTLEEPPAHSRFILATTDPEELLSTIVSRCQRFEFRRVSADDIVRRLRLVSNLEDIQIEDDALRLIARQATGSLRDALGLLEQLALTADRTPDGRTAAAAITVDTVRAVLGLSRNERIETLVNALADHDAGGAIRVIQQALDEGEDPRQLNRQLVSYLRQLLLERASGVSDTDEQAQILASKFSLTELAQHARRFSEIDFSIKHSPLPQLPLEVAVIEATTSTTPNTTVETPERPDLGDPAAPPAARPTMLRDRIRNQSGSRDVQAPEANSQSRPEPAPITPLRPVSSGPSSSATSAGDASIDVEYIANLWPNVRADVKAINRRIEALLSEVDPVAIAGNQITLAVPYPFHRDKLNSDEVREILGGVLSRILNRNVSLQCILRGEMPTTVLRSAAPAPQTATTASDEAAPAPADAEGVASRLRAAMNIFDAEEVDASTIAANGLDGSSS